MNLDNALRLAKQRGCSVEGLPGTGEIVVKHPSIPTAIRLNGRKKSASRALTVFLKKLGGT